MKRKTFYKCYRIIADEYLGYEVQIKRWWFPIWVQKWHTGWINTFPSIESAKEWVDKGCKKEKIPKKIEYWRKCY